MPNELSFETLDELRELVEQNDDVLSVPMWMVRDAYGAERLKVHVRSGIHEALLGLGLAHIPREIPDNQNDVIRVYKSGTQTARLIAAVRSVGDEKDQVIREAVGGDATATLTKIRELVC
ncbi:MAG TPA: hypothetical protein VGX26_01035 [Solirubrobacteraceae bacterium]|jgi:hypothetical protein|nr:hypothetical protein [Solirubrobacteraceae bacterium]